MANAPRSPTDDHDPWFDSESALTQLGQAQGTNDFKAVWSEKSLFETGQMIRSPEINTMSAYGMDGNAHWTRSLVEEWWRDIQDDAGSLQDRSGNRRAYPAPHWLTHDERRWCIYLVGDCHRDLRRYIAFLETGIAPDGNALPSLTVPRRGLRMLRGSRKQQR